ncbi:MAG: methyltransferase domain-containing protein [Candidatus Rokubacteria bacterium]|nr:methyltransferase domain-containing protein [Candidatus Rokubacteria bacterium]
MAKHGARRSHLHRDRLGNPKDWKRYLRRLLGPDRARWQRPEKVVRALGLRPGQSACEIGTGPGYFAFRLARAVGPGGHVYAVDAEPRMLGLLSARLRRARRKNITPVLGLPENPLLPPRACDLIILVNTYHHFRDGPGYLRRLVRGLRPGGRIVNIDFHRRPTPAGPPVEHRVAREDFIRDAGRAGLRLAAELGFLPYQYVLVLRLR